MPRELLLTAPRQLRFFDYADAPLAPDEVRAQAICSGISHGTEMNLYRGTAPFHGKRFDPQMRIFIPEPDHQPFPKKIGYEWVGRVVEAGPQVEGFQPGDRVHLPSHPRQTNTFRSGAETLFGPIRPLPLSLPDESAAMLALAGVALQAVQDGGIKVGDRVAVFGLGVIGLFAVQLARMNGAAWIDAIDPLPRRRALAETYGANRTFDPAACDPALEIKTAGSLRGADVAIELSGSYAALHEAIRCLRVGGLAVAGGYYQGGASALRLGEEWHHNRIAMVSSMGSQHCPHRDYPLWTRGRVQDEAARLLAEGRLRVDGLISHRIPFERASQAYELVDKSPESVVKVVLTY